MPEEAKPKTNETSWEEITPFNFLVHRLLIQCWSPRALLAAEQVCKRQGPRLTYKSKWLGEPDWYVRAWKQCIVCVISKYKHAMPQSTNTDLHRQNIELYITLSTQAWGSHSLCDTDRQAAGLHHFHIIVFYLLLCIIGNYSLYVW